MVQLSCRMRQLSSHTVLLKHRDGFTCSVCVVVLFSGFVFFQVVLQLQPEVRHPDSVSSGSGFYSNFQCSLSEKKKYMGTLGPVLSHIADLKSRAQNERRNVQKIPLTLKEHCFFFVFCFVEFFTSHCRTQVQSWTFHCFVWGVSGASSRESLFCRGGTKPGFQGGSGLQYQKSFAPRYVLPWPGTTKEFGSGPDSLAISFWYHRTTGNASSCCKPVAEKSFSFRNLMPIFALNLLVIRI